MSTIVEQTSVTIKYISWKVIFTLRITFSSDFCSEIFSLLYQKKHAFFCSIFCSCFSKKNLQAIYFPGKVRVVRLFFRKKWNYHAIFVSPSCHFLLCNLVFNTNLIIFLINFSNNNFKIYEHMSVFPSILGTLAYDILDYYGIFGRFHIRKNLLS